MNNYVKIKCLVQDESYILKKIIQNNIDIIDSKTSDKYIYYVLNENDYKKLLEIDYKKAITVVKNYGIKGIKDIIKANIEKFIITLLIIFIIFLSKLYIIEVNVFTNDLNLKKQIMYSLIDEGIKKNTLKKSYEEISKIKNRIMNKYINDIDWVEITKNGYRYNVDIIKREEKHYNSENNFCNYIAVKSGTVKSIIVRKGVLQVSENNYVNKGDILINGEIIYNEELKKNICASGKITGETWYKVNVSYPLTRTIIKTKNSGMYNVKLSFLDKNYLLLKDKYKEPKNIFKIGGNFLGLTITKSKIKYHKTIRYNLDEAENKALNIARKKVLLKARNNSHILSENILKKNANNGKMDIEVLFTIEEELGVVENY